MESEDSVKRRKAQSVFKEMTMSKPNSCDGRIADRHQKPSTHVKNDDGGISTTSIHSVAVMTTCSDLDDDSSVVKESLHRSDDEQGY